MKLYLVRHGVTDLFAQGRHQYPLTSLSERGRMESAYMAGYLKDKGIEAIFSSPFTRSVQTAEILAKTLGSPYSLLDILKERGNPTDFLGKKYDDPQIIQAKNIIKKNMQNPDFRYKDEETWFELHIRAKKALKFFEKRKEKVVVAVSHGNFIKAMIYSMFFKDTEDPMTHLRFRAFLHSDPGGITVCEYEKEWRLFSWNKTSYLENIE